MQQMYAHDTSVEILTEGINKTYVVVSKWAECWQIHKQVCDTCSKTISKTKYLNALPGLYKLVVMSNQRDFESNPRFNDGTYSRSTKDVTTAIYLLPTHLISG